MVDHLTNLDAHRGMAAQKATDLRRLRSEVEADRAALHSRQAGARRFARRCSRHELVEDEPAISSEAVKSTKEGDLG